MWTPDQQTYMWGFPKFATKLEAHYCLKYVVHYIFPSVKLNQLSMSMSTKQA